MYPTLISFAGLSFRTLNLFYVLAFLAAAYMFWRRGREEHYSEMEVMDAYLISFIFYLIFSRLGYIIINLSFFKFDIFKMTDIVSYPGSVGLAGSIAAFIKLYSFAARKKWDSFELLDFGAQAVTMALFFINLGLYFDGSGFGNPSGLPWAVMPPQAFTKMHPVQLYRAIFYLILNFVLSWLEYHYRTFEWYRKGRKSAQSGFLIASYIILQAVFSALMLLLALPNFVVYQIELDIYIHLVTLIFGIVLLVIRSGRIIFRKKRPII